MRGPLAYLRSWSKSEPTSTMQGLTQEWDETIKAQLGMDLLQSLDNRRVIDETHHKRKWWNRLHQDYERKRLGLPKEAAMPEDETVVRIDSDDVHYHLGWLAAALAAMIALGGAAYLLKPPTDVKPQPTPTTPAPTDTDTNLTIEGH